MLPFLELGGFESVFLLGYLSLCHEAGTDIKGVFLMETIDLELLDFRSFFGFFSCLKRFTVRLLSHPGWSPSKPISLSRRIAGKADLAGERCRTGAVLDDEAPKSLRDCLTSRKKP